MPRIAVSFVCRSVGSSLLIVLMSCSCCLQHTSLAALTPHTRVVVHSDFKFSSLSVPRNRWLRLTFVVCQTSCLFGAGVSSRTASKRSAKVYVRRLRFCVLRCQLNG